MSLIIPKEVDFQYKQSGIHFNHEAPSTRGMAAPQKIGSLWNEMKILLTQENRARTLKERASQLSPYLQLLGLSANDTEAQQTITRIVEDICHGDVIISPASDNAETGIYFVSRPDGTKIGVIKTGEEAANMTLAARLVAKQLGLPENAICGIFCSIEYPEFPTNPEHPEDSEDFAQALFSGLEKTYELRGEKLSYGKSLQWDNFGCKYPPTLTGLLVPFLEADNHFTIKQLVSLLAVNIAAGVRDTKIDAIFNFGWSKMLIDTADCMPRCFIPPDEDLSNAVSSTQINWLDEIPLSKKPVPTEVLKALIKKIEKSEFNIYKLLYELSIMPLRFPDLPSESLQSSIEQTIHLPGQDPELKKLIHQTGEYLREDLAFLNADRTSSAEELINAYLKIKEDNPELLEKKLMAWNPDLYSVSLYLENLDTDIERYFKNKNYKIDLSSGFDHGGCYVKVRPKHKLKDIAEQYIDLPERIETRNGRLISKERIDACQKRIERLLAYLHTCIEEGKEPTCHEIADAVDPFFAFLKDRLSTSASRLSMSPSSEVGNRTYSSLALGTIDATTAKKIRDDSESPSPLRHFTNQPPTFSFEKDRTISVGSKEDLIAALQQQQFTPRSDSELLQIFGITPTDEKKEGDD